MTQLIEEHGHFFANRNLLESDLVRDILRQAIDDALQRAQKLEDRDFTEFSRSRLFHGRRSPDKDIAGQHLALLQFRGGLLIALVLQEAPHQLSARDRKSTRLNSSL